MVFGNQIVKIKTSRIEIPSSSSALTSERPEKAAPEVPVKEEKTKKARKAKAE
jgi:hypothetical protein